MFIVKTRQVVICKIQTPPHSDSAQKSPNALCSASVVRFRAGRCKTGKKKPPPVPGQPSKGPRHRPGPRDPLPAPPTDSSKRPMKNAPPRTTHNRQQTSRQQQKLCHGRGPPRTQLCLQDTRQQDISKRSAVVQSSVNDVTQASRRVSQSDIFIADIDSGGSSEPSLTEQQQKNTNKKPATTVGYRSTTEPPQKYRHALSIAQGNAHLGLLPICLSQHSRG